MTTLARGFVLIAAALVLLAWRVAAFLDHALSSVTIGGGQ